MPTNPSPLFQQHLFNFTEFGFPGNMYTIGQLTELATGI